MSAMRNARPAAHTRASLYAALDGFVAALQARDPSRVVWAPVVRYSENNVALMVGDGLWQTITARGDYDLRCADVVTGQVCLFTTVTETTEHSACSIRLGIEDGAVAEVEIVVVRQSDAGLKFPNPRYEDKPVLAQVEPEATRVSRERLLALADGYFSTLERNDGKLLTVFHPDCNRVENGVQTTNNPDFFVPVAGLGCEQQFRLGHYRFDDRLRGRRYPLVDEELGIVVSHAFIDHTGVLGEYLLTDGSTSVSPIRYPHTFYLFELFKVSEGALRQIEANFITVPYHMPSPWDAWTRAS
jgi:hypothetical protein